MRDRLTARPVVATVCLCGLVAFAVGWGLHVGWDVVWRWLTTQ